LNDFSSVWAQVVDETAEKTGIVANSVENLTESVASAQYFSDAQKASAVTGVAFVDIGSSTSDISLWQDGQLIWQISIKYAGRDIFLDYLKERSGILKTFNLKVPSLQKDDKTKFYAATDFILLKMTNKIFADLPIHAAQPEIKALKKHLTLGLSGLFFYLGLGISSLGEKYRPNMPHIYFGGNGSQMLRWLTNGAPISGSHPFGRFFEKMFVSGVSSGLEGIFNLSLSEHPKGEAAYGLVCDSILERPEEDRNFVFAGENFVQKGEDFDWKEILDKKRVAAGISPQKEFEKLNQFIEAFNDTAESSGLVEKVKYDAAAADSVRRLLDNSLKGQKLVEPIFILALKELLNVVTR
jgi:hypothetical protein